MHAVNHLVSIMRYACLR